MEFFESLCGRRCRSPIVWFEEGEFALIYTEAMLDVLKKVKFIRDLLKTARSRQKYYAINRKKDLEFMIG